MFDVYTCGVSTGTVLCTRATMISTVHPRGVASQSHGRHPAPHYVLGPAALLAPARARLLHPAEPEPCAVQAVAVAAARRSGEGCGASAVHLQFSPYIPFAEVETSRVQIARVTQSKLPDSPWDLAPGGIGGLGVLGLTGPGVVKPL